MLTTEERLNMRKPEKYTQDIGTKPLQNATVEEVICFYFTVLSVFPDLHFFPPDIVFRLIKQNL